MLSRTSRLAKGVALQVVPTVGVHDDASGKKSSGLQKHFRHLVNETASKHRFLRSLHRSSSSKEGLGNLRSSTSNGLQDVAALNATPNATPNAISNAIPNATPNATPQQPAQVASRTRSRKAAYANPAPAKCQAANKKSAQDKAGIKPGMISDGRDIKEENQEDCVDMDALPELPNSLGDALGDANGDMNTAVEQAEGGAELEDAMKHECEDATPDLGTLQADPDDLLKDSIQDSEENIAQSKHDQPSRTGPEASLLDPSATPALNPPLAPANHSETVDELLSILAGGIARSAATELVNKAKGNLAAAINLFYDSTIAPANGNSAQQPSSSAETAPASASDASAGFSAASCRASAGSVSVSKPGKQAGQPPAGKQKSKGSKRAASIGDAGQPKAAAKKAKSMQQNGQRSIATFFGGQNSNQLPVKVQGVQIKDEDVQDLTSEDDVVLIKTEESESDAAIQAAERSGPLHTVKVEPQAEGKGEALAEGRSQTDSMRSRVKAEADDAAMTGLPNVKEDPEAGLLSDHIKQESTALANTDRAEHSFDSQQQSTNRDQDQSQPVHPFFGAHRSKTTAKAPAPQPNALTTSSVPPSSAHQPTSTNHDQIAPTADADQSKSTSKPSFINPFQKGKSTAVEKDVPADAVLLSVADYDPVGMALWEAGQATPYRHISRAFQAMESTTKRLRIGDAIANMFRSILALSPGACCEAYA